MSCALQRCSRAELELMFTGYPEHLAVVDNDFAALDAAVARVGGDVNARDHAGDTPLMLAVQLKRHAMVERLLTQHVCHVLVPNFNGRTPLMAAALTADAAMLQLLMNHGLTINGVSGISSNSLCYLAASNPDAGALDCLIAAGARVNDRSNFGESPTHAAASNTNADVMRRLLAAGCDPHATDAFRTAPVHKAAANPNAQVLALLVDAGVSVCKLNKFGDSPCHVAAANPNEAAIAILVAANADVNEVGPRGLPSLVACSNPNVAVLDALLAAGAELQRGRSLVTPGHAAAENRSDAVLRRLFALGQVDVEARTEEGETPLHRAARLGCAAVVALLLAAGADVHCLDSQQRNVCHMAATNEDGDVMRALIAAGAHFRAELPAGSPRTPFRIAVASGNLAAMAALVEAGVDVGVECGAEPSLVVSAAHAKSGDVLRFLVERGANVHARNDMDQTAYFEASSAAAVTLLFARGVDLHAHDKLQATPVHRVAGRSECFEALLTLVAAGAHVRVNDRKVAQQSSDRQRMTALLVFGAGGSSATNAIASPRALAWAANRVAMRRVELLRARALQVCAGLQALDLPALVTCEILANAFAPMELDVKFHTVWQLASTIKHHRHVARQR